MLSVSAPAGYLQVSDGRRNELLTALNAEFPALYSFCTSVLQAKAEALDATGDPDEKSKARLIIQAALHTLEAYVPHSFMASLCESQAVQAVLSMMRREEFAELAVQVLGAVAAKKGRDGGAAPIGALTDAVLALCREGFLQRTSADLHKKLCMALNDLGANHWHGITPNEQTRQGFLELMSSFTAYRTLSVSAITFPFWRAYLDNLSSDTAAPRAPPEIIEQLLATIVEKLASKPIEGEDDDDGGEEFEDRDEFLKFWSQTKAKLLDLIRRVASVLPLEVLMFTGGKWQNLLENLRPIAASGGNLDARASNQVPPRPDEMRTKLDCMPFKLCAHRACAGPRRAPRRGSCARPLASRGARDAARPGAMAAARR